MSWIGLDLLLDNCSSNKSCNSSDSAASVQQQQQQLHSTRTTTNWTISNIVSGDNDGYDFWHYYPDDNDNNQNNNANTRELDIVPNTIETTTAAPERNEHDTTNYDDAVSMSSYSTYEGNPPFTTTTTTARTIATTTTGNTNNTSNNNATIGHDTIETDEVTIIVPPGDTLIANSYLPFRLIPQSITTTLHRNYQIFSPASSTILSNSRISSSNTLTNESQQQYIYDGQLIDNNNSNAANNHGDADSVGVTIVPSVHSEDNMLIVPADTTTTSNTPLGELVMFASTDSSGLHRTSRADDRSLPNSFEMSSSRGGDVHIHNNTTMESRDSSLSLHPSSVESSVLTEWASIQEGAGGGGGRGGSDGNDPSSTRTSPGTSTVDPNPLPTTTLVSERRTRRYNHEESGASRYAVTDLYRLHDQQSPRTEHDAESHDDSSELESLTNSFIQEGKRLRQSSNDDNRSYASSASSPSLEPWYQGFETEQDWDEFRDVAKTVLAAVDEDDVGGAETDRDRKRTNTDNTTSNNEQIEDDDIRLARLIQEEEAVLWRKSEQERTLAATTRPTKSSTTTTIILDPKRQRVWKIATDVVFVVATAAVAAIGYQVVRQRKR